MLENYTQKQKLVVLLLLLLWLVFLRILRKKVTVFGSVYCLSSVIILHVK